MFKKKEIVLVIYLLSKWRDWPHMVIFYRYSKNEASYIWKYVKCSKASSRDPTIYRTQYSCIIKCKLKRYFEFLHGIGLSTFGKILFKLRIMQVVFCVWERNLNRSKNRNFPFVNFNDEVSWCHNFDKWNSVKYLSL